MTSLVDNLKQRKAAMISPLAFILAACGGGGGSSIVSNISDSDSTGSTGSTGDNTGGRRRLLQQLVTRVKVRCNPRLVRYLIEL